MYFFIFLKFLSKKYNYKLLAAANILYIFGYALGMVWAVWAWGSALPIDSKIIISALVPIPFVAENIFKTKNWRLPALGCALILLNYIIPYFIGTVHTH
jgi:ABC-type transport system involved in cytochrome c biogenesis permease subunit